MACDFSRGYICATAYPSDTGRIHLCSGGYFSLVLDGQEMQAGAGDLIRLPMGIPHGIFNHSGGVNKCLFWVSPTRRLYDLFWGIHSMKEQNPRDVVALAAHHEVDFLPPPPEGA